MQQHVTKSTSQQTKTTPTTQNQLKNKSQLSTKETSPCIQHY